MTNDTDRPRIHLIVDRDVWVDLPPLPFKLYDAPEERLP